MNREERLSRLARRTQAEHRIPALSVAVHRADRPLWTFQVGVGPLDEGTLFRMGSITKTFTAVLVMQCRDEGLLDLDDRIDAHLPVQAHGDLTIGRLLSHTSGLQREPFGDIWEAVAVPGTEQVLAELDKAERVLPSARRFHYSNLGLSLLGHAVGRLRGGTWGEVLADRILRPLGLDSITSDPGNGDPGEGGLSEGGRGAIGYLVDAYSDHVRPEPNTDLGGIAPAGQLWASAADLAKWAAFLADPSTVDPSASVLKESTVDEMRWPRTTTDDALWTVGFGLGLILVPQPERTVHVGHDGAMPGFLAGAYGRRGPGAPKAFGAASLGSSGTGIAAIELAHTLLSVDAAEFPAEIEPWTPGPPAPAHLRSALGRWWSEGFEWTFTWRDGRLRARRTEEAAHKPPSVFEEVPGDADELRTVDGGEAGERLRLTRDPGTGAVVEMRWATYRYTRTQLGFDGRNPGEP